MATFYRELGLLTTLVTKNAIIIGYRLICGVLYPVDCLIGRRKGLGGIGTIPKTTVVQINPVTSPKENYGLKDKCLVP